MLLNLVTGTSSRLNRVRTAKPYNLHPIKANKSKKLKQLSLLKELS